MAQSNIRTIHPATPAPEIIQEAADVVDTGGMIVFPTRSLYGLGVDALNTAAVEALFRTKQRPKEKPILILINAAAALQDVAESIPDAAQRLITAHWPGNVTILFRAKPAVPDILTGGTGKIGIRMAGHPVARALTKTSGRPITGTSANLSGHPACSRISRLHSEIARAARLILDAGPLPGGAGSTIVDVTAATPCIIREGTIPAAMIHQTLREK